MKRGEKIKKTLQTICDHIPINHILADMRDLAGRSFGSRGQVHDETVACSIIGKHQILPAKIICFSGVFRKHDTFYLIVLISILLISDLIPRLLNM